MQSLDESCTCYLRLPPIVLKVATSEPTQTPYVNDAISVQKLTKMKSENFQWYTCMNMYMTCWNSIITCSICVGIVVAASKTIGGNRKLPVHDWAKDCKTLSMVVVVVKSNGANVNESVCDSSNALIISLIVGRIGGSNEELFIWGGEFGGS